MTHDAYLGRYQAEQLIGEGGMGKVYLGRQIDNGQPVVIKVMHEQFAQDIKFRTAFQREMLLMTRFRHPYAVELYDHSPEEAPSPCIVMEYVPGVTLAKLVEQQGRLSTLRVGLLLGQLCQVLQAAHDNGIIHRDLTPVNVLVMNPDSTGESVKVMDFGLARMGSGPYIPLEKLVGTSAGIGGGTPDYVSPEQIRREDVDHRADIYSLGVLLFKCLTGFLPFEQATTTPEILRAHLETPPTRFREYFPAWEVNSAVENVVLSCLAKYPGERPQHALEVAHRYELALGEKILFGDPIPAVMLPDPQLQRRPDPRTVTDHLEAWMPEPIAVVKLRGFVHDMGGEITDSEPGLIRCRLRDPASPPEPPSKGFLTILGMGKKPAPPSRHNLVELRLAKKSKERQNDLSITVMIAPEEDRSRLNDPAWRSWSQKLCRELRAYLISR